MLALPVERQERLLVQELFQVNVRVFADQLRVEAVGLADAFAAGERQHLQVADEVFDGQAEMRLVRRVKHGRLPVPWSSITAIRASAAARTV
jgi:hypothetical protein